MGGRICESPLGGRTVGDTSAREIVCVLSTGTSGDAESRGILGIGSLSTPPYASSCEPISIVVKRSWYWTLHHTKIRRVVRKLASQACIRTNIQDSISVTLGGVRALCHTVLAEVICKSVTRTILYARVGCILCKISLRTDLYTSLSGRVSKSLDRQSVLTLVST